MENEKTEITQCGKCGTKNRFRPASGSLKPVCGKCGAPLEPASASPLTVTDGNFDTVVGKSALPVLLDMWAAWCGPCRMIAPTIEALAAELAGKAIVGKMDVDANPNTAARYHVQSIPTLLIFKDGREVDRLIGLQSREAILRRLSNFIN